MSGKLVLSLALVAIAFTIAYAKQCDDTIKCVGNSWNVNGRFKEHPTDCTKYYRCQGGRPQIFTCPRGLWWTNNRQNCVHPSQSICKNNCSGVTEEPTTVEPTTEEPTTLEPTTEEPTTVEPTTEQPTTVEPTTDEPTTEQPTTVEPETVEPTTVEPTTEAPTTVEPTTVEPTTVEPTTVEPTTVEPTTVEPTTEQPTTVEPEPQEPETEEPTTEGPQTDGCDSSKCPAVNGKYPVYLPHEDCTKFCQCDWGVAHLFLCNDGLHFNPVKNVCDWPWDAGCDASITRTKA